MPKWLAACFLLAGCAAGGELDEDLGVTAAALTEDNGLKLNGLKLNGLKLNGLRATALAAASLDNPTFRDWLDAGFLDQEHALRVHVMDYVVRCALRAGQAIVFTDGWGETHTWTGDAGLAPDWASRAPTEA